MCADSNNLDAAPDDALVMCAKNGDQDAFGILFLRYKVEVYTCLLNVVESDETAKELYHDTYVKAWRHIESLNEPARFKSWLVTIGRNLAIDWLRQNPRGRTVPLEKQGGASDPIDENADPQVVVERGEYFRRVLAKMEPVLRDVLLLYTIRGYSRAEIAHMLGYAKGTVTTYLSRARKQFWHLYHMMDQTE